MFFDRFFRPKWQHKNANIRRQALQSLPSESAETQEIFATVVVSDTDPIVRQTVVRGLHDLALLERIAQQDADATVREHAVQRLGSLLSGTVVGAPNIDSRRAAATRIEDRRILEYVARNAVDPALRWLAAERIDREALFADIAIADPDAQLRLDAVNRVAQKSTLERILKQVRTKDKRVRIQVQERLDAMQAAAEKPEKLTKAAGQICAQLDGLLPLIRTRDDWHPLVESAERLNTEWSRIKSEWTQWSQHALPQTPQMPWPSELESRFSTLWNAVTEAKSERAAQVDQLERIQEQARQRFQETADDLMAAQQFMGEFAHAQTPDTESAQRLESIAARLRERLAESKDASNTDSDALLNPMQEALDAAAKLLTEHTQMAAVLEKQASWRQRAQTLLSQEAYVSKDDLRKLEITLDRDGRFYIAVLREGFLANEALLGQVRKRLEKDEAARKEAVRVFKSSVADLTAALSDGRIADATVQQKQLQSMAEWLTPTDASSLKRTGSLQEFQRATAQLRELKECQGWGSLPGREDLCTRARGLFAEVQAHVDDKQFDWDDAAKRIRELRLNWKELGPSEMRDGKELWETFNEVCNQAYDRCQRHFAARADVRAENLAQREALIQQVKAYFQEHVAGRAHEAVDYKALHNFARQSEQAWRALGPVDRSKFHTLREEFGTALTQLREAADQERQRNSENKDSLIKRAEKIVKTLNETEQPDNEQILRAVEQIKNLQEQWKQIGRAADEKTLWDRFRAAADAVFAKRQAQFDFQNQERAANFAAHERLCAQVEAAGKLEGDALKRIMAEVDAAKAQWHGLVALPKEDDRGLRRRFSEALRKFEARLNARAAEDRRTAQAHAETRVRLCDELEILVDTYLEAGDSEAWQQQRSRLESTWETVLDNTSKSDLVVRRYREVHTQLEQAVQGDTTVRERLRRSRETVRLENLRRKEELCLRMEILAEVNSPEEAKQARLAFQVHQLAEHMSQGGANTTARGALREQQAKDILLSWWTTGVVPNEQQTRLSERFYTARRVFDQSHRVVTGSR